MNYSNSSIIGIHNRLNEANRCLYNLAESLNFVESAGSYYLKACAPLPRINEEAVTNSLIRFNDSAENVVSFLFGSYCLNEKR